ncbi:serine-tRNA ligase [Cystobasidium minutum MCA 4210]|uniref:serine-tRNA ligase n=1 Tax=Cystobasidium minutum MCA 4210 TaxID=1397322 RepID=UPI0034CFBAE5|eukprot:jgi/Rhomi1/210439/estExt_Genemark1.C_3_t30210
MGIDILDLIDSKGGNSEAVRESQRRRNASVELVDECIGMYQAWVKLGFELDMARKEINKTQKQITEKKKAKEDADDLLAEKKRLEASEAQLKEHKAKTEAELDKKVGTIGNIVHSGVPTSHTEDDNLQIKTWHPEGPNAKVEKKEGIFSHHEVMYKLDILEQDRGTKVAGHRGFFLINDGVDLNQALITYGLNFLRTKGYKKVMTPFMMKRNMMAKTAQLSEFDEALYKLDGSGDDDDEKYLIATSEQPLSAFHADEWLQEKDLPHRYAGYSTCFRKEAGSHGRDTWGIFRIHQFEKIEQFCVTEPEKSWEMFEQMCQWSEEFYQSLGLPYQVVAIVSGALNNAAAKKHDLEAWFPYQGEYKELVSVSNCLDYQSRSLEVRCGAVQKGQERKKYVHMLNGTLCATERALCCLVENYQTPEGLVIPEVLRPYMGGRDFIPYVKSDLPKGSASTKPAKKK